MTASALSSSSYSEIGDTMNQDEKNQGQPAVTVRCVACKSTREIGPGEVAADDVPMCERCFMPMFAESAHVR